MSFVALATLAGAMGWAGTGYVYSQLSPTLKQRRPVLAASIAGGIVGLVIPVVLNLLLTAVSR